MFHWLTEPLQLEFMRHALVAALIAGVSCPIFGAYLVVQRLALLGDVMTHTVMPGVALAYFWKVDVLLGAMISGVSSSFIINWLRGQTRVKVDSAMALTSTSFFALGVLLLHILRINVDLHSFLFGDLLGVTVQDLWRTGIIMALLLVVVRLCYQQLLFYTFDPLGAEAIGLPVRWLSLAMMAGIALTIIASMQTMGVILVIALLVGPSITAYLLVKELHQMMGLGALIGGISSLTGLYISYFQNLPLGPVIVLVIFSIFCITMITTIIWEQWLRQRAKLRRSG